ncbi:MAG: hypothetical protein GY765_07585 [bacterium]|nr:hypothetical protein [bacterium]
MKTANIKKKLVLIKQTIAGLDEGKMRNVPGGIVPNTQRTVTINLPTDDVTVGPYGG